MIILGLAGPAGCGKDTIANYLVERYGYTRFAFSDALYDEVQEAFGLEDQDLLRNRETKETLLDQLALINCQDEDFIGRMQYTAILTSWAGDGFVEPKQPLSPRQVLQWWGTDYRRAQDPDYWIKRAQERIMATQVGYPEQCRQHFVECGTRFENERKWIMDSDGQLYSNWQGNIWHIHRDALKINDSHISAQALPVLPGERELWNNDTIERLYYGVDLLMSTSAPTVRVEPMLPYEPPERENV